jgi:hypothetical protein
MPAKYEGSAVIGAPAGDERTGYDFLVIHTEWSRHGELHYFAGLLGNGLTVKAYVTSWGTPTDERWVSVSAYRPIKSYFEDNCSTVCSTGTDREGWSGQYGLIASDRTLIDQGGQTQADWVAWANIELALPGFLSCSEAERYLPTQGERIMRASDFLDLFAIKAT